MSIRIAINGFGRIGRMCCRSFYEYYLKNCNLSKMELVAINTKGTIESAYNLIKYDSVHGRFGFDLGYVKSKQSGSYLGDIIINNSKVKVFSELNPENLPWKELGVDLVYECTGAFKDRDSVGKHIFAGAKKVLVSANCEESDLTVVYGVNEDKISCERQIISNASCTTNCAGLVLRAVEESFDIISANFLTVHAYTSDQLLLDNNHKDLYRARAAGINIIPTSSNVSDTLVKIYPHLKGLISGSAIRVPVANVSYLVSTIKIKQSVSSEELRSILCQFVDKFSFINNKKYKNVLYYTNDFNVSTDFNHHVASAIIDLPNTFCIAGDLIQVYAWYDNEWAYSCRMHDMADEMFYSHRVRL